MASTLYSSKQDFAATMANLSKTSSWLYNHLPRTLGNDSQATFARHLHDAMGYRSDQPEY